jgi:hypothetical protein
MFNYKKMLKLKIRASSQSIDKEEGVESEEGTNFPDATLEDLEALQTEQPEPEEIVKVDQNASDTNEDDDAGIMRSDVNKTSPEGHKLYKFSEQERHHIDLYHLLLRAELTELLNALRPNYYTYLHECLNVVKSPKNSVHLEPTALHE